MKVVIAPDPKLRAKTKPVKKIDNSLLKKAQEMIKITKTFKDPEGVGLASTQVGLDECFFVGLVDNVKKGETPKFTTYFNPKIISGSKKTKKFFDGCLSIPNYWGEVTRHATVKVSYQDETGKIVLKNLKGLMAHIFQHEIDHLNGILFVDKVLEQKNRLYKTVGKDRTGQDVYEQVTI